MLHLSSEEDYCSRGTARLPVMTLTPLPSRPGRMVSLGILGALPKTEQGNEFVLLVVGLFLRARRRVRRYSGLKDSGSRVCSTSRQTIQ